MGVFSPSFTLLFMDSFYISSSSIIHITCPKKTDFNMVFHKFASNVCVQTTHFARLVGSCSQSLQTSDLHLLIYAPLCGAECTSSNVKIKKRGIPSDSFLMKCPIDHSDSSFVFAFSFSRVSSSFSRFRNRSMSYFAVAKSVISCLAFLYSRYASFFLARSFANSSFNCQTVGSFSTPSSENACFAAL